MCIELANEFPECRTLDLSNRSIAENWDVTVGSLQQKFFFHLN